MLQAELAAPGTAAVAPVPRTAEAVGPRTPGWAPSWTPGAPLAWVILLIGVLALAASGLSLQEALRTELVLMGSLLVVAALLLGTLAAVRDLWRRQVRDTVARLLERDLSDCCLADARGRILARNPTPPSTDVAPPTIGDALAPFLADAQGLVDRLQAEAAQSGQAEAEVATGRGCLRLSVRRLEDETFFWRGSHPGTNPGGAARVAGGASPTGSDGQFWEAIEDLPLPLMKLGPTGVVLAANGPARALLPMPITEGCRLSDLLEGLGRPMIEWVADVAEGRPASGPQFLRGTGGHHDTTLRVALSLAGPPGDRHLIALLDDVTELKAIEAQFVQSQKMQALGQLAGGVAHDFNNLLTAISGHCDLLLLRHDQGDPDYPDLIQIRQNVNRAASLVGQLLAFSRKQSMMPETIDLRLALSDLTHLLNRLVGEKVRLALHHDPAPLYIRADRRQLEQVVMNLVVNARDAMPDGGEIGIETRSRRLDRPLTLDRATIPPGRYVVVTVSDVGTGIPPERLPKIFEPFYTTKKPGEGTGLGLSTAYGIIKQSGGFIFADSEVGRGTTFTLWFPAHDKPRAQPVPAIGQTPGHAGKPAGARKATGAILLVEDEPPVRAFAVRALRLRGYTVIEADCAEAALRLLSDPATTVDLILTDVILPDMDGPTWVREALRTRPGVKVVFVSGYAEEAFTEQKALIPGSIFLPKPFSLVELTTVADRALAGVVQPETTLAP